MLLDNYSIGLLLFAVSMVATPGPANMILLNAGSQFGFKKAIPFVFGIILSKQLIIWPIGFGILTFFELFPNFVNFIKFLSCTYIIWLAWKLSNFKINDNKELEKPPSFFHGLPVHPTNPKAWAMVSVGFSNYTNPNESLLISTLILATIFIIIQFIFHNLWCFFGVQLKKIFQNTKYEIWLMRFLSLLMLGSLVLLFLK
ncbi:MAG: protein AmbA [Rhodobacterales bacterium]|nr:MAG: protein AmbA [Rhodobacterales bacterium]|tara:strand:- start:1731 stop:2330 length:600 start_codon:yes stop_codon:yes gene_type:complete